MELDDYLQIQNLLHRYAAFVDAGDFESVGALFANGDFYGPGVGPFKSDPKAVEENYRRFLRIYEDTGTPRTRHVSSNLIVDQESPSSVRTQSNVVVFQAAPGFPLQPIIASSYRDRFEKVNGRWRFAERRIGMHTPDLFGDLSSHLTGTDHFE